MERWTDGSATPTRRNGPGNPRRPVLPSAAGCGLLLLGPIALALRGAAATAPDECFSRCSVRHLAVGALLWGLIVFGPARTVVHVGTYMIPIMLMAGSVAALRAVLPRFAPWYVGAAAPSASPSIRGT